MRTAAQWLKDPKRDYAEGLELLKQLNAKDKHISFLSVPSPDEYKVNLLRERVAYYNRLGMQAVVEAKNVKVTTANKTVTISKGNNAATTANNPTGQWLKIDKNPIVRYEDLPAEMKLKFDAAISLGREMTSLQASLKVAKSKAERARLATALEQKEDERRGMWDAVNTWWATNKGKPVTNQKPATNTKKRTPGKSKTAPKKKSKK